MKTLRLDFINAKSYIIGLDPIYTNYPRGNSVSRTPMINTTKRLLWSPLCGF